MSQDTRKSKKSPVARRATPDAQIYKHKPDETLKSLISASEVLTARHAVLSWDVIAYELGGGVDRGTLSRVANGKRDASAKLISKLNSAYGCHLHLKTIKANIPVCEFCDKPYTPRHTCKVHGQPRSTTPNATRKRSKRLQAMRAAVKLQQSLYLQS